MTVDPACEILAGHYTMIKHTGLCGSHKIEKTCHACYRPWVVCLKDFLKNQGNHAKLYNASYGGSQERAAHSEAEGRRKDTIQEDEREREPDVSPS